MDPDNLTIDELIQVLKKIDYEHIQVIDRDKNKEFRNKYGLSITDTKDMIKQLKIEDLYKGPVEDDNPNRKHPVWIFIKNINLIRCYIKMKVINKCKVIIVISFHECEY